MSMTTPMPLSGEPEPQAPVTNCRFNEPDFNWRSFKMSVSANTCVYAQVKSDYTKDGDSYFVCVPKEILREMKTVDSYHSAEMALDRADFNDRIGLNGPYDYTFSGSSVELKEFMDFFGVEYSQELETVANDLFAEENKNSAVTVARDGGFVTVSAVEKQPWEHLIFVDMALDENNEIYDVDIKDRSAKDPTFVFKGNTEAFEIESSMFGDISLVKKKSDRYHKLKCKVKNSLGKKVSKTFRIYSTPAELRF